MTAEEKRILEQYSTPGLRKSELTKEAKRSHLRSLGVSEEETNKIVQKIFNEEKK